MGRYIIRRLLQAVPQLFIISIIIFALLYTTVDPIAAMTGDRGKPRPETRKRLERKYGLDQPWFVQYIYWLVGNDWLMLDLDFDGIPETPGPRKGILRGDFGLSVRGPRPALEPIGEALPNTLLLMGTAEAAILGLALLIGVYSALRQYSIFDHFVTAFSFIGYSMPIFFIALFSLYIFSVLLRLLPSPARPLRTTEDFALALILPALSISFSSLAGYSRYVRSAMLEVLNQDYIRTARSKGLPRPMITFVHALKNASLPLVTLVGLDLPMLLGGAVVTETIFAWPGMGQLFIRSLGEDPAVVMAILMLIAVAVVIFQLLTDLTYAWLDPRIRYR